MIKNKSILVFGGAGYLGRHIADRYVENNKIIVYSRDENKHFLMNLKFNNHPNITYIVGDVRDSNKIRQTLLRVNPHIIILAAALKHIEKCEVESDQCVSVNITGTQNVLNEIEYNQKSLNNLENVIFISTDKSVSPVNLYGQCKAVSEGLVVEKSIYIKNIQFKNVRYGNVLNSSGSILCVLHEQGKNPEFKNFTLTHKNMTRFLMTVEDSIDLIEYAILYADSGDTVIPRLMSCKMLDLFEIFSEIYNKPVVVTQIRPGEKLLESLINETQSMRLIIDPNGYMRIKPHYFKQPITDTDFVKDYNSTINPMSKDELKKYLTDLKLI